MLKLIDLFFKLFLSHFVHICPLLSLNIEGLNEIKFSTWAHVSQYFPALRTISFRTKGAWGFQTTQGSAVLELGTNASQTTWPHEGYNQVDLKVSGNCHVSTWAFIAGTSQRNDPWSGTNNGGYGFVLHSGQAYIPGGVTSSDIRLKEDIEVIENATETIKKLKPKK